MYKGSELNEHMKIGEKAKCIVGLYANYIVEKSKYGNRLLWEDQSTVDETCRFFKKAEWEIIVDKS